MFNFRTIFYKFGTNIADSFKGYNFLWHSVAIVSTYIIVVSDFDFKYYQFFHNSSLYYFAFTAAAFGGLLPILVPVVLLTLEKVRKSTFYLNIVYALAQAAILGSLISAFYKMLTGRLHPIINQIAITDITHIFRFGLFQGGVFWGWPSSHTTVAFAMAFTLWMLFPKNRILKVLTLVYAFFIGLGVSMTIHWFSDFVAGAIIGTVIGIVVGKSFKKRIESF